MESTPAEIRFARACYFGALFSLCILAPLTPSAAVLSARECHVHAIYELACGLKELAAVTGT